MEGAGLTIGRGGGAWGSTIFKMLRRGATGRGGSTIGARAGFAGSVGAAVVVDWGATGVAAAPIDGAAVAAAGVDTDSCSEASDETGVALATDETSSAEEVSSSALEIAVERAETEVSSSAISAPAAEA